MIWHVNRIVWLFFVLLSPTVFTSQTHCAEIGKAGVYSIVELTFHGPLQNETDVPARDIDLWIRFRHESGSPEYKIHGFWDGDGKGETSGNVFKVRFCPTKTGRWNIVEVYSNKPSLHGQKQGNYLTATASGHPARHSSAPGWNTREYRSHDDERGRQTTPLGHLGTHAA